MKTHPENICTNCNNTLDAATAVTGPEAVPNEGDISIYSYCGQLGVYDNETKIRKMKESEMYKLFEEQPDVAEQILKIQSIFAYLSETKTQEKNN